jgi:adenylate cyclase, class 2
VAFEIELKVWVKDREHLKKKLDAGYLFAGSGVKNDIYFLRKNENSPVHRFRVRLEGEKIQVTIKNKIRRGGFEENKEVEFYISDLTAFTEFARQLGYEESIRKRKEFDIYHDSTIQLELNHVDYVGDFLEIEKMLDEQSPAKVKQARDEIYTIMRDLGFNESDIEERYYTEMLKEKKDGNIRDT